MNNKLLTYLIITVLTIFGGFVRFYKITTNPNSLNIDEVSYGYSAYSILKTGRDENGIFMPLVFQSTGDYKSPVLIYSLVPSIAMFGLNAFSVRFTTALAGTLSIPIFFLLLVSLLKSKKIAFVGAILLTISPWHIYYSRFASDHLLGFFILILGMLFFLKMLEGRKFWVLPAALILGLSMYTYYSQRFFVPLFLLIYFALNINNLKKTNTLAFLVCLFILVIPLLYLTFFGPINTRAGMIFLSQDIDYTRYVILDHLRRGVNEYFLLFFFWIKRYLNYFQADFLFFNGLNMTALGTLGLGVLHLFELPYLVLGIISLIKEKLTNKKLIIIWILVGIIPASLTNNEQSSGRSLIILPVLLAIVSVGAIKLFYIISKIKNILLRYGIISTFILVILITLINAFLVFTVHFPKQRGEAFMEGTKQTVLYALQNKDKYKEIVYDPTRGIEAPYIVNIPHMYILFYSGYDPALYQSIPKRHGKYLFSFDKFTIRRIDWRTDREKRGVLFIGSPWSLPAKDLKDDEILQKVYLANGNLALLIVSPK